MAALERARQVDERWEEAFRRHCKGESVASIMRAMNIADRRTCNNYIDRYKQYLVESTANPELERQYLIGRFENVVQRSLDAFEELPDQYGWHTDPRPSHMNNAVKALQMIARLKGLDARGPIVNINNGVEGGPGETEVRIKVGGVEMVRKRTRRDRNVLNGQAVEVASREISGPESGPLREDPAEDGEAPGGA